MANYIDLDHFLTHIRLRGIPVGVTELQRLQSVFLRTPDLSRPELKELFCALLAKNAEQRHCIRRLFEQLFPYEAPATASDIPIQQPTDQQPETPSPETTQNSDNTQIKQRKPLSILITGSLFILLISLGLFIYSWQLPSDTNNPDTGNNEIINPDAQKQNITHPPAKLTPELLKTITLWQPEIRVENHSLKYYILSPLILFCASGLGFFWLLHQTLKRTRIHQLVPPSITGKSRFYLPPLQDSQDYFLLNGHARREIAWGINHVLTDVPLSKLDIARSVRETARTGLPSVHFKAATRLREILIWQDQRSENLDLSRLADEISVTLQNVNIEVQRGYFHGMPDIVRDQKNEIIWSLRHPQPHNQPIILIMLDTDTLYAMDAINQPNSHYLLQIISDWDPLGIIDCSQQPGALSRLLKPYGLSCLLPQQVSYWLAQQGADDTIRLLPEFPLDQLHQWALACALPDRPLMIGEIRALHDVLRLDCAWQLNELIQRYARRTGTGLDFSQQRRQSLQELTRLAATQPEFLQQAVKFWLARYQQIDHTLLQQQSGGKPWKNSVQQYILLLETSLLQLWLADELTLAAKTLYRLQGNKKLRKKVTQNLGQYALQDWPEIQKNKKIQWITLPYKANSLDSKVLQHLLTAGLGGNTETTRTLRCNQQTSLITGLLGGISFIALIACGLALRPHTPVLIHAGPVPATMIEHLQNKTLLLGTPKQLQKWSAIPQDNSSIVINWQSGIEQDNIIAMGNSQLWRAGTLPHPPRPSINSWPSLSIAVIATKPGKITAQKLALKLLDSATADQVLIGTDWFRHLPELLDNGLNLPDSQWLYFFPEQPDKAIAYPERGRHIAIISGNWQSVLNMLNTPGIQMLSNQANDIKIIRGSPVLNGVANTDSIPLRDGIILQRIPKGSFQMGDKSSKYDSERPIHTVTFKQDFYISQTEITFAQYDAYAEASDSNKPDDRGWGRVNQPVINVSWDDTQGYTQWLSQQSGQQCRLPSEAEWEYAARAGSTTKYSWGDKVGENNANCDGCGSQWDNKQTAPVTSFQPNDWGLYDMHGNVFEWTEDCWHNNYTGAPNDGTPWTSQCSDDGRRVLRGGSWVNDPEDARSAFRVRNYPVYRNRYVGFRVVCSLPYTEH